MRLVTLPSYSNTFNTSNISLSRDRALYGSSLILQTRRHQFNKQSNQNEDKSKIDANKYEYNNNIRNTSLLNNKPNNGNCCAGNEKSDSHASESNPQSNVTLLFTTNVKLRNHSIISEVDVNRATSHIFVDRKNSIKSRNNNEYEYEHNVLGR